LFDPQQIQRIGVEEALGRMPVAAFVAEAPSGKLVFVNDSARRMIEGNLDRPMPYDLGEIEDFLDLSVSLPDGRPLEPERRPLVRAILSGEEVRDEEYVYTLAEGGRLTIRCSSWPVLDEEGRVLAGVLLVRDVTEERRAEERRRYHAHLLENIHDAVIATDEKLLVTAWNKGAQQMYGWRTDEVLGRHLWEAVPVDMSEEQRAEALRNLAERGRVRTEAITYAKDGTPVYVEGITVALRGGERGDGEIIGYVNIRRSITERKQAEEEIERRAHQQAVVADLGLRALAKHDDLQALMDETVAIVARTLDVEYSKIVELLPGGEEVLLRAGVGWREGLVGEARERAGLGSLAGYTALISNEAVIVEDLREETRFEPPPLLVEHGVVSGMSVVIPSTEAPFGVLGAHTTSHRTFSEDDINFLQAVANVLATAIEREGAQEQVEEGREAERSRIARDIHDEPLQELTDALVQLQQIQRTSEDPQQTLRLARLLAALDRIGPQLRGAIYDLRLQGEETKLFPELLESLVDLHRGMAPESDIALEVHDGVLSGPLGERGRQLLRILGEALTNVRRHSGASHVRLSVGITEEKLWAEVVDDGVGFDATQQQEDSEEALPATGGLGIRGMRERARALAGDLEIESDPETGTKVRFEMTLKKARAELETQEPEEGEPEEEPRQKVRILLVEDHAAVREAIASSFEREAGFEVVGQAASLAQARRIIGAEPGEEPENLSEPVDVAVIDLGLPDGYGGELIGELRESNPGAQALVLSANLGRAELARAVESGAGGVLHKTVHLDEMVDAVRRLRAGETLMPVEEVVELLRFTGSRREEEYEARRAIARLTSREIEVLQALTDGLNSKGIAGRLNISLRTERNHASSILAKLGVHSQLQALVFALRHGVVELR
jgi:PAS domain S-box-containing protein